MSKKRSETNHGKFFLAGAANSALYRASSRVIVSGNKVSLFGKKAKIAFTAVKSAMLAANIIDSAKKTKESKSIGAGIGNFVTNAVAGTVGSVAGAAGMQALISKAAPLARKAKAAREAAKDTIAKTAPRASDAVKGSVLNKNGSKVRFVRIRGRIVPIRKELK